MDRRGVAHQGKIYLSDDSQAEVFDMKAKTWSAWPAPPFTNGAGVCFVSWNDVILCFGAGASGSLQVLQYEPAFFLSFFHPFFLFVYLFIYFCIFYVFIS